MGGFLKSKRGALAAVGVGALGWSLLQRLRTEDLTSQVALVTGASRGLGYLLARELGRNGCRVVICARDEAELERARGDLARQGFDVTAIPCDVAQRDQVEQLIDQATREYGRIDLLVNNAGIIQTGPEQTMRLDDYHEAMDVMFWGTVYPTKAVLPQMIARGSGRIVNITSIGGKVSVPHLVPYSSAKFAAVGFSEGLRAELSGTGVSVTTIVPGLMRTGSHLNAYFKGDQEQEYTWFSLGASLPGISMDAERAARQIVEAARRREAERILSVPAAILVRVHGVAPALTSNVLGLVDRIILPDASPAQAERARGMDVDERIDSELLDTATTLGTSSAERFHQFPGPAIDDTDDTVTSRT